MYAAMEKFLTASAEEGEKKPELQCLKNHFY
jgi:hypothetical protein